MTGSGSAIGNLPAGLIGALGLGAAATLSLAGWLQGQGARPLLADGPCRVWVRGEPVGGLRAVREGTVHAWLLGDLLRPAAPDADALTRLVSDGYRRDGHRLGFALVGQFALLLWDAGRRELSLYRDGSAAQTLYYSELSKGALLFADRLDLLLAGPLLAPRLAPAALHEYLRLLDISSPNTPYLGVCSIEPGQLLTAGRHGLHRHDGPAPAILGPVPQGLEAAATELERCLNEAVAERLDAQGETVVFLSGGVDSACLCALAAARDPTRVRALTVGFAEPQNDESGVARAIAAHLRVRHEVLRFDLDTYREAFDDLAASAEYPFADPAGAATLLAFRHARGIGRVALDGTGADTLLGIMPARHQRLAVQYGARLPAALRQRLVRLMASLPWLRDYRPLLDFADPEEVLMRWAGFTRQEIAALCGVPVDLAGSRFYRVFRAFPRDAHFERYSALMGNLPDDRLHVAAALTGLKVRFPFFEPRVQALVGALGRDLRWRQGEPKRVLKAVLARHVPRQLWDLPKHGFDFPFVALLAHRDFELVRTWLAPARIAATGLFDPAQVDGLGRRFIAGERAWRFRVWGLVVLLAWLDRHPCRP